MCCQGTGPADMHHLIALVYYNYTGLCEKQVISVICTVAFVADDKYLRAINNYVNVNLIHCMEMQLYFVAIVVSIIMMMFLQKLRLVYTIRAWILLDIIIIITTILL